MKRTIVGAVLAALGGGVHAAEMPGSGQLDEIVVTAQKRAESLQQVPVAVSAFDPDALAERSIGSVQGLSSVVPNVEMNVGRADSAGSALAIYVRGVGQNDFLFPNDPGVGLYVDGVYLARSVGANLDLADVERIEVLRGPQGTLYGKNTIGGAVNVYTRRPNLETYTGSFDVAVGSRDRRDANAWISGPIVAGTLGFKVSATTREQDGFVRRVFDGTDLGDRDASGGRAALLWRPREGLELLLSADYSRKRENGAPGLLVNTVPSENLIAPPNVRAPFDGTPATPTDLVDLYNGVVAPAVNAQRGLPADSRFDSRWLTRDGRTDYGTGPVRNDAEVRGVTLDVQWRASDALTLRSITAFRDTEAQFARDADHTPYDVVQTNNDQAQDQLSQELQLDYERGPLVLVTGAFYMRERARDDNLVLLLNPITELTGGNPNLDWRPSMRVDTDTWAVFAQGRYALAENVGVTVGGRYSEDRKALTQRFTFDRFTFTDPFGNVTSCYTCLADGITGRTLEKSWGAFTPKLGVEWQATPDVLVYASASRGFKSGGWSPRPTPTNPADQPFDPEYLDSLEVGAKTQWFDRRLTLNTAAFWNRYTDVQLTTLQPNFTLAVTNAGRSRLYGAEVELVARPVAGLDLNLSLGHLQNRFTRLDDADPNFTRSDRLPDAPRWTVSTGAQYTLPLGAVGSVSLRVDGAYRSRTWKDAYNLSRDSIFQFFGPTATATPVPDGTAGYRVTQSRLAQPGYWIANARLAFRSANDRWEAAASVTNLADREYLTTILPVSAFGFDEGFYGAPREWGVSVGYRF